MKTKHIRPGLRDADHLILTRIAQFDSNEPRPVTELTDEELAAEYTRVRDRGTELSSLDTLSADESTELGTLAGRLSEVQAEQTVRSERAAELQSHRDAFAAAPEPAASTPPGPPNPGPDTPPATEPAAAPSAEPQSVTASAPAVPSVATLPATEPQIPPAAPAREFSITLTADGAGAVRRAYNDDTPVTVKDVTRAVLASFKAYGSASTGGQSAKRAIAQFTRERAEKFELTKSESDYQTVQELRREGRLSGGSLLKAWRSSVDRMVQNEDPTALTAAAGWCAPSENLYDLCSLWSMDGILDLPTATARRGGFNYVQSQPTWADLDAATNFTILTEAQVIADTAKNCAEIPCPTFTDTRLDVAVTCITGSFLQAAGYPEMVETWVDGTLTNHAHKLNENIIARIVTQAGAATVIPGQGAGGTGTTADTSATASILSAIELAATDMRYADRMSFGQTFEVILPHWVLTQMRADIIRKNGWSNANAAVADPEIVRWFTVRNIRPQFVYDWQDFFAGGTGPGNAAAPLTALPATVNFLIYPAGAVVLARQDVVTLSNVYDAANLQQNLYTRLFTEEGFNLLFPCGDIRQYTAQACPSGATGHQVYTSCAAPAA